MMNTKFKETNKKKVFEMTQLYSQIFAVCMQANKPILQTIIYLNENFERIYVGSGTDVEVYEYIFDKLDVKYSINKPKEE